MQMQPCSESNTALHQYQRQVGEVKYLGFKLESLVKANIILDNVETVVLEITSEVLPNLQAINLGDQ